MAVNATAVWRVRPSGSNTNGGGYDPNISGAGTDYSQQNSAQVSGTHGTTTGTTTFTDATALAFTAAMIGNAIYITGTGQTTGWYFVTARTSSSVITLDRSPGTGTLATWHLGGGWADFWTNTTATGPLVAGNIVYILGSGTPNPASYTYDYTAPAFTPAAPAYQQLRFLNDPSTPGYKAAPDTTGGMPCVKFTGASVFDAAMANNSQLRIDGLWFVAGSGVSAGSYAVINDCTYANPTHLNLYGCVLDQYGFDVGLLTMTGTGYGLICNVVVACECFSSQGGSGGTNAAVNSSSTNNFTATTTVIGVNFHDCVGFGVYYDCTATFNMKSIIIEDSTIAKNSKSGIYIDVYTPSVIKNCTIDGNGGDGITLGSRNGLEETISIFNNIISNQTGVGKYGINAPFANYGLFDFNTYYNNTADLNNLAYGPHDTHGGSNPYVGQSTENYTLA